MLKHLLPFRKRNNSPENVPNYTPDRLTRYILKVQHNWVTRMSQWEQHFSVREKKILLFIYLALMSLFFSFLIYKSLFLPASNSSIWKKQNSLIAPVDIRLPDSLNIGRLREIQDIHDSLEQNSPSK